MILGDKPLISEVVLSQLIRDTPGVVCLPLFRNLRRVSSYRITDLIDGWGHCGTNRRCAILDVCLIFDAPHGHPGCQLHPGASQDLVAALPG
jgi:hypothetical protein